MCGSNVNPELPAGPHASGYVTELHLHACAIQNQAMYQVEWQLLYIQIQVANTTSPHLGRLGVLRCAGRHHRHRHGALVHARLCDAAHPHLLELALAVAGHDDALGIHIPCLLQNDLAHAVCRVADSRTYLDGGGGRLAGRRQADRQRLGGMQGLRLQPESVGPTTTCSLKGICGTAQEGRQSSDPGAWSPRHELELPCLSWKMWGQFAGSVMGHQQGDQWAARTAWRPRAAQPCAACPTHLGRHQLFGKAVAHEKLGVFHLNELRILICSSGVAKHG